MKVKLSKVCASLLLAVAGFMIQPIIAQEAEPSHEGHEGHHGFPFLTPAENEQLKKAQEAVFAANPDLKKEGEDLHEQMKALRENTNSTPEEKQALHEKMRDHEKTVHEAMLKEDPTLQPIFDKIKEHTKDRKEKKDQEGDSAPAN